MSHRLPNYLRTYRRRNGLSQDDVALLLGCENSSKVSRYEHSARRPNLETTFAYETIFGTPVRELYAGTYQKVEERTKRRAGILLKKLLQGNPKQLKERKIALLKTIANARLSHNAISKT